MSGAQVVTEALRWVAAPAQRAWLGDSVPVRQSLTYLWGCGESCRSNSALVDVMSKLARLKRGLMARFSELGMPVQNTTWGATAHIQVADAEEAAAPAPPPAARSFEVESVAVLGSSPIVRVDPAAVAWPSGPDDPGGERAMAMAYANGTTMVSTSGGRTWSRATGGVRFIPGNGHGVQNATSVRNVGGGAGMPEGFTCTTSPCKPATGPFRTDYAETATIDPATQTFSWGVDRATADQAVWQSPPHPVVDWNPGAGGMVSLGGGAFLGTPVVWYADGPTKVPQGPPPNWGACCNSTVLAYISRDGKHFSYRSEIASKATVLQRWPTLEGPNENDVVLLPNRSILCIMRKDGGDGPTSALLAGIR